MPQVSLISDKSKTKDYTHYTFLTTVAVIALLSVLSVIPPSEFVGVTLRRANIYSDIFSFSGDPIATTKEGQLSSADSLFMSEVTSKELLTALPIVATLDSMLQEEWFFSDTVAISTNFVVNTDTVAAKKKGKVTPIEDLTVDSSESILELQKKLLLSSEKSLVRIAVFGDSFIEADILTADMRESLQEQFGGKGTGFVPFASPLTRYRSTIKHTHSGWKSYNIMQKKKTPAHLQDKFYVSGTISIPSEGAKVEYRGVDFRDHIEVCDKVRLLFINSDSTKIDVVVNDSISHQFTPEPSDMVQQIIIRGRDLSSLSIKLSTVKGFVGYGAVFESNRGVGVDNYSVRSNSGSAIFGTSYSINNQVAKMLKYDAIVLQYGLNSMSQDIVRYSSYGKQFDKIIDYTRKCFPGTPIIILSVGDRSMSKDGSYVTMPGATAMIIEQRAVAVRSGVNFWNTYDAMALRGGMPAFVKNGWAAKDYTHIAYGGGAIIGSAFANAIADIPLESIVEIVTNPDSSLLVVDSLGYKMVYVCIEVGAEVGVNIDSLKRSEVVVKRWRPFRSR